MRKGQDYVDNLSHLKSRVFVQGQLVDNLAEHPLFQSTIFAWGKWLCDAAFEPELQSLMTAKSEFTGDEVHIFWHIPTDQGRVAPKFRRCDQARRTRADYRIHKYRAGRARWPFLRRCRKSIENTKPITPDA